ncbi:MAG: hypothetical protein KJ065_04975 [Anaerolineae bacterium]|nr:hypothetical protein [Anaerolineae bacterium]
MLTQKTTTAVRSTAHPTDVQYLPILILFVLLAAYALLPWVTHPTAALTSNAYDLAEWASIFPAVRSDPLLLTALLLRLPLVGVAWWVAGWNAKSNVRAGYGSVRAGYIPPVLQGLIVVVIAIALLPPFEFLTGGRGDPNYQQQALLAAAAFLGGLAILWWRSRAHHDAPLRILVAVALVIGAGAGLWGIAQALNLWQNVGITASIGAGGIVFAAAALVAAWLTLRA